MIQKKVLDKTVKEAALKASRALAELAGTEVEVVFSKIGVQTGVGRLADIKSHETVAGVYLPIGGKVKGASLLLMSEKIAFSFCDLLLKRKLGTTKKFSELDKSALKEVGNIVCGSVLTVFAKVFKIKFLEKAPYFSFDTYGQLLEALNTGKGTCKNGSLVMQVQFRFFKKNISGHVLLIFEMAGMNSLLKILNT